MTAVFGIDKHRDAHIVLLANVTMEIEKCTPTANIRRDIFDSLAVIEPTVEDPQLLPDQEILRQLQEKHSYGCCVCETDNTNMITWKLFFNATKALLVIFSSLYQRL